MQQEELLYNAHGNANGSHFGVQCGGFLQSWTYSTYNLAIVFLAIYSNEFRNYIHSKFYTRIFIAVLVIIAKMQVTKVFFNKLMDTQIVVHTFTEILFSFKINYQAMERHQENLNAYC